MAVRGGGVQGSSWGGIIVLEVGVYYEAVFVP